MDMQKTELLLLAAKAAIKAGNAIKDIYSRSDFEIETKSDNTPLTLADRAAHEVIIELLKPSGLPVLSEESSLVSYCERKAWKQFWLVDPLDGTKEFIKRNGEFTVNIALIEDQLPTIGVIYVPVSDELYAGDVRRGAWKYVNASGMNFSDFFTSGAECKMPFIQHSTKGIVASRSHLNPETSSFIEGLKRKYPDARIVSKGSSLKLCMIAEGEADIYPRFSPTSEWDTAAGHAIVVASGAKVEMAAQPGHSLRYNKEDIINPWFIAFRETMQLRNNAD